MPGEPTEADFAKVLGKLDRADFDVLLRHMERDRAKAREEGRRAGLEETVEALLEVAHTDGWCDTMQAVEAIRALATKEPA